MDSTTAAGASVPRRAFVLRYGLALVAPTLALLWRLAMVHRLGGELPTYITFYPAVILVAIVAGLWPGILATVAAGLLAAYFVLPPRGLNIAHEIDVVGLALFTAMGVTISVVCELYHRSRRRAAIYQRDLAIADGREALWQASEQRTLALDAAGLGTWDYHLVSGEVLWDSRCRNMFGVAEGDKIDYTAAIARIHDEDRPAVDVAVQEAIAGRDGGAYHREFRVIWPDGSEHWVESYGRVYFEGEGEVRRALRFIGVNADITERKRLEQQVRRKAEELEKVMEVAPVAIWVATDPQCSNIIGNDTANRFYEAEEGENVSASARPSARAFYQNGRQITADELPMQYATAHGVEVRDAEFEVLMPSGTQRTLWGSATPLRDEHGNVRGCVGAFVDVTARKRAENDIARLNQELQRRAAELETIFETVPIGVAIADNPQGTHIRGNPTNERIFGLPPGSELSMRAPNRPPFKFMKDGRELTPDELPMQRAVRGEIVNGDVIEALGADRTVNLYCSATPLFDEAGRPRGAVGTFLDMTQMKRAEKALIRSEKLASVGRMAATVAHEINNPLAAVMNSLYLARHSANLDAARTFLDLADQELQRIALITRQALGFYRESVAPAPVTVSKLMDSAIEVLASRIAARKAVVHREYDETLEVTGVGGELRQVFANLLANSLDAIPDSGSIKVRISSGRCSRNGASCVKVLVADNGTGIERTALPRLFEPFFTTKDSVGTGLGLWVSKQIVENHRGTIRVRTATKGSRRGASFCVILPVDGRHRRTDAAAAGRPA